VQKALFDWCRRRIYLIGSEEKASFDWFRRRLYSIGAEEGFI
jgi:hypothetical protein